jgi:ABC-type antimicrobial peptide transport system permease subunit
LACFPEEVAGVALGIPMAAATARVAADPLSDLLFGVKPVDPLSFALAASTMILVALFAGYLPARKASEIDPMVALRQE